MNDARRKDINRALGLLQQAEALLDEARSIVETAKDEEREYFDNMHENLQGGEKGEKADAAANNLEEVHSALEELDWADLTGKLEEAVS